MDYYNEILEILAQNFEKTSDDTDPFIQYAYKYDDGKALYVERRKKSDGWELTLVDLNRQYDWVLKSNWVDSDEEMYEFLTR